MSNVQNQNQQHQTEKTPTSRWPAFVFDVGRWTLDIGLLLVLCAASTLAQENRCALKLADLPDAPELFGFRPGQTSLQIKTRLPRAAIGKENELGISKMNVSPDFDPLMDKSTLAGVRTLSIDFLDGRVSSLWFGYDNTFKWKTVPDFVRGISRSLHLPDAWQPWKTRGQQLKCADFEMTVVFVAEGPSFHLVDENAEQTVNARRQAEEEP
jgi:hypothetical protein